MINRPDDFGVRESSSSVSLVKRQFFKEVVIHVIWITGKS